MRQLMTKQPIRHRSGPLAEKRVWSTCRWFSLLLILYGFASCLSLHAQSASPAPAQVDLPQELLKSLQDFRKSQNALPELKLPSASNVPGEDPNQQRLRSIQQRMELIRSLVQQKKEAEEKARLQGEQNAASNGGEFANGLASQPQGETSNAANVHTAEQPEKPSVSAGPPEFPLPDLAANNETANSKADASPPPKFVGQTVVPSAVDPLELANSLFQTGNYDLALKTYLAVADKIDKPQDAIWTDYFIASCQRILGDLPAAEKGYRSLVESRRPTRPVEAARWWLDNVERRKSIAATLNDLEASLKVVSGELNANGNKK